MEKYASSSISEELSFRYANKGDESLLLAWRNNPNVRKYSRTADCIDQNMHSEWFEERLNQIQIQPLLIFNWNQQEIGMVRLDKLNPLSKIFEISILVDESYQNRGFATSMISQSLVFAKLELSAEEVRATIHTDNISSMQLFIKMNFLRISKIEDIFQEYSVYL
jgi:RimJ/RimL family protein N-acetyltransferase